MNGYYINNNKVNNKNNIIIIVSRILVVILIIVGILAQNNLVVASKFVYADSDLPKILVGYKVVHISDICNTSNNIISLVKLEKPDIILLSGGYQDKDGSTDMTVKVVNELCKIAPVYYIYGTYDKTNCLDSTSAVNITDSSIKITSDIKDANEFIKKVYGDSIIKKASKGDTEAVQYIQYISDTLANEQHYSISVCGINNMTDKSDNEVQQKVYDIAGYEINDFTIMLNGNINNTDIICKANLDIVLTGGTFGKSTNTTDFSKGAYSCSGTQLFVSGGCGNYDSKRIFNLPEIQVITLSDGTIKQESPLENILDLFIDDVGTVYDNDGGFSEYTYKYGGLYNKVNR